MSYIRNLYYFYLICFSLSLLGLGIIQDLLPKFFLNFSKLLDIIIFNLLDSFTNYYLLLNQDYLLITYVKF